jgi:hypothetical protein
MSLALYASPYDNKGIDNSTDNLISKKRLSHNKTQKYYNKDNNQSDKVKNIIKKIHDNSLYSDSIDGVEMGNFSPLSPPESSGVSRTIERSSFKENYSGMDDNNDNDNYNYINSKNNSVNMSDNLDNLDNSDTSDTSDNSNYYKIPSDNNNNNNAKSSMQQRASYSNQPNQQNQPNASNYVDSIEYNDLKNNYGDNKSVEEYYKKFSPNYSYGTVSNWNRNAQSQGQTNMNNMNKKIYANENANANMYNPYNNTFSPSSSTNIENSILLEKLNYMIHLLEEQQDERTNNVTEEVILYCFLGIFMIFIVDSFTRVGKYVR